MVVNSLTSNFLTRARVPLSLPNDREVVGACLQTCWRIDPAEMEKLTTPQRIERRQQMMAQRMGAMNARAEATKTFYNALRPEQRTIFDQQTARGGHRGGAMGGDNPGAGHRHG